MINDRRFMLNFEAEPSQADRLIRFLSPYDVRIYVTPECYLDIGSGSLATLERVSMLHAPEGYAGSLGTIGRWCEFATTSEVMRRGEHDHDQPVNASLGELRAFTKATNDIGMRPAPPIAIGSGVIISAGARVLSGVRVGDGAVIGANAVVRHDVEPFTIVAGIPARPKRKRLHAVPWWDFAVDYLIENLHDIQAVAAGPGPHRWRIQRPRFVLRRGPTAYYVSGFTDGENVVPIANAPDQVRAYIDQAFAPGMRQAYWVPDCWA